MRVLRSSLVAATAIIAAACGDKVTVPPAQAVSPITSVTVAPASATISVGQSVTLVAAINAGPGITPTVTWSSSSAAATVSSSGAVLGVSASPGVAICATATSGTTSVEGCAQVVVQATSVQTPAVLQIASITTAGNLNNPVPVPPGFVAGQINVSINLNPNAEKMDSVVVMVNGKGAGTQTFTSAQAAALRSAANAAGADQALQSTLVFSINTAAYAPATGAVTYPNGAATISVVGYGHVNGTAATNTSSQGVNLLFGNADAWIVGQTIGTTKVVNNGAGFAYTTGSVAVTAIPVLYSGAAIGTATVQFGTPGCDNTGLLRTLPLVAPAAGSFAWTATFPDASQTSLTNNAANRASVNSYEYNSGCASNAGGGEGAFVSASQYTNTNSGPAGTGSFALGSGAPVVRLDNRAPQGLALAPNAGTRTGSWFNDAVILNGTTAASAANGIVVAANDNGVGGIVYTATVGGNVITSTASLAESAANNSYTLSEGAVDGLGNATAAVTETFGVDRTAPVLAIIGGSANNLRSAVFPATSYSFSATDNTTTVGASPSAFFNLGATPLSVSQLRRNAVGSTFYCPATPGYVTTTAGCASWATGTQNYAGNLIISEVNGSTTDAYYTVSATVADQAGNTSNVATRVELDDATAPAIGGLSYPPFMTAGGSSTFTSTTVDNLDIQLERLNLVYGAAGGVTGTFGPSLDDQTTGVAFAATTAGGGSTFWYPDFTVNTYNNATLVTTHAMAFVANPTLTQIQSTGVAGFNAAAVNAAGYANTANGIVLNQANTSASSATPILAAAVTTPAAVAVGNGGGSTFGPIVAGVCPSTTAAALLPGPYNWVGTNAVGPALLSLTGAGGLATSVTLTAQAQGCTASGPVFANFSNPFVAVQFWVYDPTAGATEGWRLAGTVNNATTVTDGGSATIPAGRNYAFSFTFAPGATTTPDAIVAGTNYRWVAIGIGANGMALATPVSQDVINVKP